MAANLYATLWQSPFGQHTWRRLQPALPGKACRRRAGEAAGTHDGFGGMRPNVRGSLPHVHKRYSIGIFRRSPLGNRKVSKDR